MSEGRSLYVNGRFLTQPVTGVQRFALQISQELVERRPDVTLVVPPGTRTPEWLADERVEVVGRRGGHAWEQLELPRYLRAHGSPPLVNLASTAPAFYENQIVTHHDITYVRFPASFSRRFRLLYAWMVPRFLRSSAAIVTVSQFSKHEISAHYRIDESKISVVANAADSRFQPGSSRGRDRPYFLAVSSPNGHKNFQRLLQAFELVADEVANDLVIIGEQSTSFATQRFDVLDTSRIRFTGRVADEQLIALYQNATAFVFPSLYEGFGIPPLEAQQCGIPVAASSAAAIPEVLGDSAVYFDPTDVRAIGETLAALEADPVLRDALIVKGFDNARRFSWERSASEVSEIIDSLWSVPR